MWTEGVATHFERPARLARAAFTHACLAGASLRHGNRGFTVVEVMITVAIIGILAGIGFPIYADHMKRGKIIEATTNLTDMRVRLEQYALDARVYPTSCIATVAGPAPAGKIYLPASSKYFTIGCTLAAATFTITATGNASEGMGGFIYTIDQLNNRRTTGLPAGWQGAGVGSTCWVIRKSGAC